MRPSAIAFMTLTTVTCFLGDGAKRSNGFSKNSKAPGSDSNSINKYGTDIAVILLNATLVKLNDSSISYVGDGSSESKSSLRNCFCDQSIY